MGHPICEATSYVESVRHIDNFARVDEAMTSITWGLHLRPEEFPVIPGYRRLRLARTSAVLCDDGTVMPELSVTFRILEDPPATVELLYVEVSDEET